MKIIKVTKLADVPVGCIMFFPGLDPKDAIERLKKREIVPEVVYQLMTQIHVPKEQDDDKK